MPAAGVARQNCGWEITVLFKHSDESNGHICKAATFFGGDSTEIWVFGGEYPEESQKVWEIMAERFFATYSG